MTEKPFNAGAFKKIKRPGYAKSYTPDFVELMLPKGSLKTEAGFLTQSIANQDSYEGTGIILPTYTYLATGRFFSTQVAPMEYGDGEVSDALLMILYYRNITDEQRSYVRTGTVVRLTRTMYTEPDKLYRIVTGNPYPNHIELKLVPVVI